MYIRLGSDGSSWIEWQHIPPAPGSHFSRVGWSSTLWTGSKDSPPSVERKRIPGVAPSQISPSLRPGSTCQVSSSFSPDSSGRPRPSARFHVFPSSADRWNVPP